MTNSRYDFLSDVKTTLGRISCSSGDHANGNFKIEEGAVDRILAELRRRGVSAKKTCEGFNADFASVRDAMGPDGYNGIGKWFAFVRV